MFSDIGKAGKDLLEDDYFYTQRLKIKTTNESKLSWLTDGELSSKGVNASISASRLGSNMSLDKFRVNNDGRVLFEASLHTNDVARFRVSGEDGRQEPGKPLLGFGKLGFELRTPSVSGTADIDVVNGPIVRSSLVYSYKSLSIGAEAAVNTRLEEKDTAPELTEMNVGVAYRGPDWNLSARSLDSFGALRMTYMHSISPGHAVSSKLNYRLKGNGQKLSVGTSYR